LEDLAGCQSQGICRSTYPDDRLERTKRVGCHSLLPVEEVQGYSWEGDIEVKRTIVQDGKEHRHLQGQAG
jgi:hypothetical protein